jgi:hypothetical protein
VTQPTAHNSQPTTSFLIAICTVAAPIAALLILLTPTSSDADAIVVTKAMTADTVVEFYIEESVIRAELEIGLSNLPAFHNLLPDEIRERMGLEPADLGQRLMKFVLEDFVIRADGGPPLPGRVTQMEARRRLPRDELTGEPLPAAEDEGDPVIFAVLEYPFHGRPETMVFQPPKTESGIPAANIGFITYHLGLPVMDFRYLSHLATLDLDWADPWYSKFRNRNLWRQYDSPMNVFLYVEPYEVRVEIIARPRDVQGWADVGVGGLETLPVKIQPDVMQKVAAFFLDRLDLRVDGEPITPELDRINFLRRTLRTSTVISPPEELDASAATLGVIFVHPTSEYPQEATVTWDLFTSRIQRIPGAATDEAGPLRFFLQPDDNVLWWKNFLKNPDIPTMVDIAAPPPAWLAALVAVGWIVAIATLAAAMRLLVLAKKRGAPAVRVIITIAALLVASVGTILVSRAVRVNDERAQVIVSALLHNVYRAFDFRQEDIIYDTLERSVTGDLLTQTYLETRRGLELASQGGARAKVKAIEMLEVDAEREGRGFTANATWNVAGSVGHWGHIHQRTNQYVADITVEPVDGVWKITALELIQEERL